MKLTRISSYFEYLKKDDDEFPEDRILQALQDIGLEQYETVADVPTRIVDELFMELIGGNKCRKMDPNQQQDILDVFEECTVKGQIELPVIAKVLRYILRKDTSKKTALIVVDIQNDFISGSLALKNAPAGQEGSEVIPVINDILDNNTFDIIVYSKDWHPEDHLSFVDNVEKYPMHECCEIAAKDAKILDNVMYDIGGMKIEQCMWPVHCVQDSEGAEFHPDLKIMEERIEILKGQNPEVDSYSVFWDNSKLSRTDLLLHLYDGDITTIIVCGLAFDFCVACSAIDGFEHGFETYVVEDACRGVTEECICNTRTKMTKIGIKLINASDIRKLIASDAGSKY